MTREIWSARSAKLVAGPAGAVMTAAVERIGIGKEESVGGAAISLRRECRLPCGRFRRARRRNLSRRGDTLLADNIGVDFSSHCQARVHFLKV